MTAHTQDLQKSLFEEIPNQGRRWDLFLIYITATIILPVLKTGKVIPFILEKRKDLSAKEEIMWLQRDYKGKKIFQTKF
jgi:hypothetical protein